MTWAEQENEREPVVVLPPEQPAHSRAAHSRTGRPSARRRVTEWATVLLAAALVAFAVRTFAIETFYVPSPSMTPTLLTGDRILVDKLPWVRDDIHRGDVVVFRRVPTDPMIQDADLVKRVIGLPGETIWSVGDTIFYTDPGSAAVRTIDESWLPKLDTPIGVKNGCPETAFNIKKQTIGLGHYFVMGDCRGISYDSRAWGTVPASYIVGKVFLVIWRNGHPWFDWF